MWFELQQKNNKPHFLKRNTLVYHTLALFKEKYSSLPYVGSVVKSKQKINTVRVFELNSFALNYSRGGLVSM